MNHPNIIQFHCHDLGKHLGCYGALVESPNIDRFAARGVKFNRAFCSATACSPSRGCLMTGQYSHRNGMMGLSHLGWGLRPEVRTIVDELNDAGYETVHIGHNHERHVGLNHYQIDLEESPLRSRTDHVVDDAVGFLESRVSATEPFYLNLGVNEVHAAHYSERYDDPYGGPVPPKDVYLPLHSPDEPPLRKIFGRFQAAIRFMDHQVGRLLQAIEELGYFDNSIVVFTTDHGISNCRSKGTLYDRGTEIALIMHLPGGFSNGYEVDHLVPNVDMTPTYLEAAGVTPPERMDGRSFWPLLTREGYTPNEAIFTERNFHDGKGDTAYDPQRAIRTPCFHYIRRFRPEVAARDWMPWEFPPLSDGEKYGQIWPPKTEPRLAEELYDVTQDPGELRNLADRPEYRRIKAELVARLERWMRETDDPVLSGDVPEAPSPSGWGYPRDPGELAAARLAAGLADVEATSSPRASVEPLEGSRS